jgi:hypothetical protein
MRGMNAVAQSVCCHRLVGLKRSLECLKPITVPCELLTCGAMFRSLFSKHSIPSSRRLPQRERQPYVTRVSRVSAEVEVGSTVSFAQVDLKVSPLTNRPSPAINTISPRAKSASVRYIMCCCCIRIVIHHQSYLILAH